MDNKGFYIILATILIGTFGVVAYKKKEAPPQTERPGIEQADKGQKHVADGSVKYDGPEPPTSGDHSSPLPWQAYDQPVPDMNIIHNLEHGGIYISYQPGLPPEQVARIKALFTKPYGKPDFQPTKALIAPRAANDAPIIMSSWRRSMKLQTFDEQKMIEYYLRNVGKAPEGTAS